MELVSVIIPTYKRKDEFKTAFDSVINQTYRNIEVVIVDDNDEKIYSEKVVEIISHVTTNFSINYIKNKHNLGGALSRNVGINAAKGEYIAFLDDDDAYSSTKVEKQLELFKKTEYSNLGIVYCYTQAMDANDKILLVYKNNVRGDFLYEAMIDCIAATSQWLCKKNALLSVGGFSNVPSKQDSTLLIKLAHQGYQIDYVPEILSIYYERNISRISGAKSSNIRGELILRESLKKYYSYIDECQVQEVEYNSCARLFRLYLRLKQFKLAWQEYTSMLKNFKHIGDNFHFAILFIYRLIK